MLSIFYNLVLLIWALLLLPKALWQRLYLGKNTGAYGFRRLFPKRHFPKKKGFRVWIHAVSLGEAKIARLLCHSLSMDYPEIECVFSCCTDTGMQEIQTHLPKSLVFYLPLDFSFTMESLVGSINPDLFIGIEGDLWYHLLLSLKRHRIPIVICSAKISELSYRRFKKAFFFGKRLYALPDMFLAQTQKDAMLFRKLGVKEDSILITGNIKDSYVALDKEESIAKAIKEKLGIQKEDFLIVIGSTHDKEEELLLDKLSPLLAKYPHLRLLFVPRHPDRFPKVRKLLKDRYPTTQVFSEPKSTKSPVMLLDEIGKLSSAFLLAQLAILGGSFVEGIGGHNLLEPVQRSVPVLFGPYAFAQKSLSEKILALQAGFEVHPNQLKEKVEAFLKDSHLLTQGKKACQVLKDQSGLPLEITRSFLKKYLHLFQLSRDGKNR